MRRVLEDVVGRDRIGAVVVATEPSVHLPYALWAMERGLPVLLDKPLTVHPGASTDPAAAQAIADDFDTLLGAYRVARRRHPKMVVSVLSQRRWHPAFRRVRELIAEVAEATNCPVSSVQSSHGDGQWRLPDELVDLSYHGFDRGYGKAAHSGYHHFDTVPWWLAAGERPGKEIDEIEVHAACTRPSDVLAQLTVADHARLLPSFASRNPYTEQDLLDLTAGHGEVDVFLNVAYRNRSRVMALGNHSLAHTTFSQRGPLPRRQAASTRAMAGSGRRSTSSSRGPSRSFICRSYRPSTATTKGSTRGRSAAPTTSSSMSSATTRCARTGSGTARSPSPTSYRAAAMARCCRPSARPARAPLPSSSPTSTALSHVPSWPRTWPITGARPA